MWKRAKANPLYFMGLDRIGCWLCPACELAEFKLIENIHPELWIKWERELYSWAKQKGLPNEWVKYGLWRWQKIPGDQIKIMNRIGVKIDVKSLEAKRMPTKLIEIRGHVPCKGKYSINGVLDSKIDISRVSGLAPIIGKAKTSEALGVVIIKSIDGEVVINTAGRISAISNNRESAEKLFREALKLIVRACYCTLCSSCVNVCPVEAVEIKENKPIVNEAKCIHCLKCQEACPASSYIGRIVIDQVT